MDVSVLNNVLTAFIILVGLFIIFITILLGLKPILELKEKNKHELELKELEVELESADDYYYNLVDEDEINESRITELTNKLKKVNEGILKNDTTFKNLCDNVLDLTNFTKNELSNLIERVEKLELKKDGIKKPKLDLDDLDDLDI